MRIILEPEAALEYCYSMHKYRQPESTYGHTIVPNGKQFMIVDIGGMFKLKHSSYRGCLLITDMNIKTL